MLRASGQKGPWISEGACPLGWGPSDRPKPNGSWKERNQASPDHRCQRHPEGCAGRASEPARLCPLREADRRRTWDMPWPRKTTPPVHQTACGQGLRFPALPHCLQGPWNAFQDRSTGSRVCGETGQTPLGGGTDLRLVQAFQAAHGSLRKAGGYPPGVPQARSQPHLLLSPGVVTDERATRSHEGSSPRTSARSPRLRVQLVAGVCRRDRPLMQGASPPGKPLGRGGAEDSQRVTE